MSYERLLLQNLAAESDERTTTSDERWWVSVDGIKAQMGTFVTGDVEIDNDWVAVTFAVCPLCDGTGTHVNPSIDAHGLTAEDFEDEDFRESYRRGDYDIRCNLCQGEKVVPVPVDPEIRKAIATHAQDLGEMRAEMLAEMRVGA